MWAPSNGCRVSPTVRTLHYCRQEENVRDELPKDSGSENYVCTSILGFDLPLAPLFQAPESLNSRKTRGVRVGRRCSILKPHNVEARALFRRPRGVELSAPDSNVEAARDGWLHCPGPWSPSLSLRTGFLSPRSRPGGTVTWHRQPRQTRKSPASTSPVVNFGSCKINAARRSGNSGGSDQGLEVTLMLFRDSLPIAGIALPSSPRPAKNQPSTRKHVLPPSTHKPKKGGDDPRWVHTEGSKGELEAVPVHRDCPISETASTGTYDREQRAGLKEPRDDDGYR
ncbi:hypothetical protein C8R47DRAFT_1288923 [Mycena vitilis]|nr:hypothetical protein C8R47DRAFT_1288923 [Mycena vitilis]